MQQGSDRFRLVVRRGPTPSQSWDLDGEQITIGRDVSNDIVINDPESSRQHLRLRRRRGGGYELEDLGSTNGTFVNGQRLSGTRTLRNGDMLGLGETVTLAYERVPGTEGVAALGSPWSPPAETASPAKPSDAAPLPEAPEQQPAAAPEPAAPAPREPAPEVEGAGSGYDYDPYDVQESEPRGSNLRWLFIGCGGMLLLCCCLSVVGVWVADLTCLWRQIPALSGVLTSLGFYITC